MKRKLEKLMLVVALAGIGAAVFTYPDAAASGASRGLSMCGAVIIPSLLPFLVMTGTFMRCSLCDTLGRLLARPAAWLFRLPGVCAAPILLSFIGGYPAGATAVEQLLENEQITEAQAARMMHFCVNAGPAFAVSTVGAILLRDVRVGWLLLAAHLTAAVCIGVAESVCVPRLRLQTHRTVYAMPLSAAFTEAVNAATRSLLYMCGFVILFSVASSLLDAVGVTAYVANICRSEAILPGLLEVSSGCVILAGQRERSVALFGFFLGFGGLSVHCQVRAILQKHPAALKSFFLFRLLHGALGGCLSFVLYRIIPLSVKTLASDTAQIQPFAVSPTVSLVLLCMCGCFLISSEKKIAKRR